MLCIFCKINPITFRMTHVYIYIYHNIGEVTIAHAVSVSLLLHCNRYVHNFDLGLNWGLI